MSSSSRGSRRRPREFHATRSGRRPASRERSSGFTVGGAIASAWNGALPPWVLAVAFIAVSLAAYHPAWHGGLLWDDDGHLTPVVLQPLAGLWRIWFEIGATQQYYPVVHSAFWILHRIFGDDTLGYHLVNVVLHAASAFLLAIILRRLNVPGGDLAAAIFALHPVEVESVAWMSELKNVLSGVCYLASALAYLEFDRTRRRGWYVAAFGAFLLAVFAKTVTVTLPAALLVVFWWRDGRTGWRERIPWLAPFAVVGVAAGLLTIWVEHTFIGARGADFSLTLADRILIAGRATWFYLVTIAWPLHLVFVYPKWALDPKAVWQDALPVAVVALAATLWAVRRRARGPFAALAYFLVTLAPALGFVSVYPFRYSYVADHFQYLACIGPIVLAAAGLATWATASPLKRRLATGTAVIVVAALGVLTWRQSREYVDGDTLYRATIARNPSCWLAYNNLGNDLNVAGKYEKAAADYRAAIAIDPGAFEPHQNLGLVLQKLGRATESVAELQTSLRLRPDNPQALVGLGAAWQQLGRLDDAIAEFREALRLRPDESTAELNLGETLAAQGHLDDAIEHYRASVRLDPTVLEAHLRLADALRTLGRTAEALAEFQNAVRMDPSSAEAHNELGVALEAEGRLDEARAEYATAVRLAPDAASAQMNLGRMLMATGHPADAFGPFEAALRLAPDAAWPHRDLANLFMALGRPDDAVREYRLALHHDPSSAETWNNLGVALSRDGHFTDAVRAFEAALRLKPDYALAGENLRQARARLSAGK